jgi:beta-galactosidase GanA
MKQRINKFVYGAQYYRAPTPLPDEWEYDLKKMHKAGIDTIQLRIQWRWNEPAEGQYEFDDIDRLFELSEKYGKQVIIKFMMETAPDYIFHKYNGTRKDMHGLPIAPGAHGAYYVGGWWPCFENPDVMNRALEFVKVFTRRYKDKANLILWNIWNEPRSRPIGDCGCECSREVYRQWLRERYKTIENLNDFLGKKWEKFATVNPPGMPCDYTELFLWRTWAMHAVSQRLEKMYNAVKAIDDSRPAVCHVGTCTLRQDVAGDGSDDLLNSSKVDFYGTSFATANKFSNLMDESRPFMVCDWLRSLDDYYWIYELYPDWGDWHPAVTLNDFRFKVWSTLASGAKGIFYWQYRAERLGNENNLAGLVNMDGSFKAISHESARIKQFIVDNEEFLLNAKVKHDNIGILYSLDSDMISRIENTGPGFYDFDLPEGLPYLYKKAVHGIYALFRELGLTPVWIDARKIEEKLNDVKVLYIPEAFMLSPDVFNAIRNFAAKGGRVIAEEGVGLRQENTWLHPSFMAPDIAEFFGISVRERVSSRQGVNEALKLCDGTIPAVDFISYIECGEDCEKIGEWQDGRTGAARKNNVFYLGTSLGASFHDNYHSGRETYLRILSGILRQCANISLPDLPEGVYLRTLIRGEHSMHFVFNRKNTRQTVNIKGSDYRIAPESIKVIKTLPKSKFSSGGVKENMAQIAKYTLHG